MGQKIEPFDVEQFFAENARQKHRTSLTTRLTDWIQNYGDRAPWDTPEDEITGRFETTTPPKKSKHPVKSHLNGATTKNKRAPSENPKTSPRDEEKSNTVPEEKQSFTAVSDHLSPTSLYRLLDASGSAIDQRRKDLQKGANTVRENLTSRNYADIIAAANIFRVWIGAFWAAIAGWLYVEITNAKIASNALTAAGVPIADATSMAIIFGMMAILGALTGLLPLGLASAKKTFSNDDFIKASDDYGLWIANILMEFDARLQNHRQRLSDRNLPDNDVLREVSLAHIAAEEAAVMFNEMSFLGEHDAESHSSTQKYRDYLNKSIHTSASAAGMAGGFLGFLFGAAFGIMLGGITLVQALNIAPSKILTELGIQPIGGLEQYPLAFVALIFPAGLLLAASPIGELFTFGALRGVRDRRLAESLNAVRSSITGAQAPRARDIAQRVEDLSEIFRVRLANSAGGNSAFSGQQNDTPAWRQQDEGPRFVNTGFGSSPKPFLADASDAQNRKKISPVREAKRGLFGLGKPRSN